MPGYLTKVLILIIDVGATVASLCLAILLTNNFSTGHLIPLLYLALPVLLGLRIGSFIFFKTYMIIVRYIGEKDYRNSFFAVTVSSAIFGLAIWQFPQLLPADNQLAIITVDYTLLLLATIGVRIFMRNFFDQINLQRNAGVPVAIFGAGEMGAMLEKVLRHRSTNNYKVVAFFDDNPKVHRKMLNGVRIYNPEKKFDEVIQRQNIQIAIIAINKLPEKRRIEFISACLDQKVQVKKVPNITSWIDNKLNAGQLRDINFEDLLSRPPIKLNQESIQESVNGKVILVTGCAGSIGSEIVRQLLKYRPRQIIGFDQAETPLAGVALSLKKYVESGILNCVIGDVKDYDKLDQIFEEYRPDYVFHAAAYKHVPVMERFPEEAVKVNVQGTKNVADLSVQYGAEKFVMISTDKVVNPGNVMGASKRIAEIYVQALNYKVDCATQFITTRFGNVLGSNGSVIPIFREQIERRRAVTVTHPEVTRFFMTIPEACQLVLEAGAMGNGGEIFVFDMGEPVKIVQLAQRMIQMAGLTPGKDIDIVFTGLRPGEKLAEELLDGQEGILKTHHPKIKKARVRVYDYDQVCPAIEHLVALTLSGKSHEFLVKCMKEIVPEFSSQNSVYARLDRRPKEVN